MVPVIDFGTLLQVIVWSFLFGVVLTVALGLYLIHYLNKRRNRSYSQYKCQRHAENGCRK